MPVALLDGIDREQVHGTRRHQPEDLRSFQIEAAEAGAVDRRSHAAERAEDEVSLACALVNRGHLIAP